jgi:hypothetical protein
VILLVSTSLPGDDVAGAELRQACLVLPSIRASILIRRSEPVVDGSASSTPTLPVSPPRFIGPSWFPRGW